MRVTNLARNAYLEKMKSNSDSELVSMAASFGRVTNTIGTVFAAVIVIIVIIGGVALVIDGNPMGFAFILFGLLLGSLTIILYRAVQKNRKVAAVVGAWNVFRMVEGARPMPLLSPGFGMPYQRLPF